MNYSIVIVDDNEEKGYVSESAAKRKGFNEGDITGLYSPGNKKWDDYVIENLNEIRERKKNNIILFLDRDLGWRVENELEKTQLSGKLFINLVNNGLKEGDAIICSSGNPVKQFEEYKEMFFPEESDYVVDEEWKKVIGYKGILVVMPNPLLAKIGTEPLEDGLEEVKMWSEINSNNTEGTSGSLR